MSGTSNVCVNIPTQRLSNSEADEVSKTIQNIRNANNDPQYVYLDDVTFNNGGGSQDISIAKENDNNSDTRTVEGDLFLNTQGGPSIVRYTHVDNENRESFALVALSEGMSTSDHSNYSETTGYVSGRFDAFSMFQCDNQTPSDSSDDTFSIINAGQVSQSRLQPFMLNQLPEGYR